MKQLLFIFAGIAVLNVVCADCPCGSGDKGKQTPPPQVSTGENPDEALI